MRALLPLNRRISLFAPGSSYNSKSFYSPCFCLKDPTTITNALNFAESSRSSFLGSQIHCHIIKVGLSNDIFSQNNSIKMYTNCGVFSDARKLFDEMPDRNLVSWTLIISGANKNGEYVVALESFIDLMRTGYFLPNEFALGSTMKACISMGAFKFSLCVHCFSVKIGMEKNDFVASSILNMYAKYGYIKSAERFFHSLNGSDLGCWNAMVGAYVQCGYGIEAINTVSSMHSKGTLMDEFTFIHALNACSIIYNLDFGSSIHGLIIRNGFEATITLMNSLIDMYFKNDENDHAWKLFETMEVKDIISWNTILSGSSSSQVTDIKRVIRLFNDFIVTGLNPNHITFSILFRICGDTLDFNLGLQLYSLAFRFGLHDEPRVSSCVINMFFKCGSKETARSFFDSLTSKNTQNWNEMIHGYNMGHDPEAIKLFVNLWGLTIEPDECTFSCAVEACFRTENVHLGRQVHAIIVKSGFSSNGFVSSSLIHGYTRFGFLSDSYAFINEKMDIVSWGGLISGLVYQGHTRTAIGFLNHLKRGGNTPDSFIFGTILNACATISSLNLTKSFHTQVLRTGFDTDEYVTSAIIDAYAKSGEIKSAAIVFHSSRSFADVALYNTIITAYANHGRVSEAMEVFEMMKAVNLKPSQSTFVAILSACSHVGRVDLGRSLFRSMELDYKMVPSRDTYGCLVDLLSRKGFLREAEGVIETMRVPVWPGLLRSFMNGCRIHGEKELGEMAAKKLMEVVS